MGKVVVLSTGGTIASRRNAQGASVASDASDELLSRLPYPPNVAVTGRDVLRLGSYLLTPRDMGLIAKEVRKALEEPDVRGIVVTHGTDTMEETAFLVDLVHDDPRPVVFTGAQRAADAPDTDGPRNLADAITIAAAEEARNRGVLIVFDGAVYSAKGTRKTQTLAAAAFATPDGGPIGQVRQNTVSFTATPERKAPIELGELDARVDIVALYPGADTAALDAVVAAGAGGVVLEATGAGNANPRICEAVARLTENGTVVALSTRVHAGPVVALYGNGGGVDLVAAGAIPTGTLRPSQVRILLTVLLSLHRDPARVAKELAQACASR
ncbi:L-asparaginase [Amycolatopsis bartoniae]|uniref:asparaginase n=1 Tax=Amycolatopsis bartoniae TaxID=941986 RepID=A0A8H9MD43_9PSEU|nr:asparaginase [Amycolatopsis bartoniae]MBB2935525.1 L-asparaginase [Amycolatopsis bartoniae]TVT03882.1 asparaginase [Amycolatopsis bartoniae]GHF76540.1 L-asparaginase [Amycolatopsis bartoniae]